MALRLQLLLHLAKALAKSSIDSPFTALGCHRGQEVSPGSIWKSSAGKLHPSCSIPVRDPSDDGFYECVDSSGKPDLTSIFLSMPQVGDKIGCFLYEALECKFDMAQATSVEFDIDLFGCEDVWAAPLWASPEHWKDDSHIGISGEVDFAEFCPVNDVWTNFACGNPAGCRSGIWQGKWGSPQYGFGGPRTFGMHVDGPDLHAFACDLGGTNCVYVGCYKDYLDIVNSHSSMALVSDLWNDNAVQCNAGKPGKATTSCQYAVKNIRVNSANGDIFPSGQCSILNGKTSRISASEQQLAKARANISSVATLAI